MPLNKDFSRRIEILDECLRRRQKKWSVDNLLEAVNSKLNERYGSKVSKRTLYGDLAYLKDEKGAPIGTHREGQNVYYIYDDATYSVMNLPISDEEIVSLKDAVRMLRAVSNFSILGDVDAIIEKLEQTISTNVPDSRSLIQFEKQAYTQGAGFIDDLFTATKDKSVLKIAYQPFAALEPQEWIIHPYLLKEYRNRWFVICRRDGTNQVSNLALDRIREIRNSSIPFSENDLFDPETYYDNVIGASIPYGEVVEDILLTVRGMQVHYITSKPLHKSQEVVSIDGDSITVKLRLINNYELQALLLSYTPDIEVLQPIFLRNQLIEKYSTIIRVLT